MPTRLLPLLFVALALLLTSETRAQLRDIRLAPELRDYSLPAEAQIQSVASLGSRHLVAWGTTAFDNDSNVINLLWMRMLDGSTPLMHNRILHSEQARPYGFVLVVASAQQFLVFWNDRRADAPGTYVRRFDFNGVPQGDEERIDIGPVKNDPVNRPKSELSALTFTSLPGWTFVQVDSARPFVVRDNAVVDTRPLAIDHMQGAYYLAEDTSVAVLKGKAVEFYRNLFDAAAERTVAVPQLDSALANTEVVMRDSSGRYGVVFGVVANLQSRACRYWRIQVDDTSSVKESIYLFADIVPVFPDTYRQYPSLEYKCLGGSRTRGCENAYRIRVDYQSWIEWYEGVPDKIMPTWYTDIYDRGSVIRSEKYYNTAAFNPCSTVFPAVIRSNDSQTTSMNIVQGNDTIELKSQKAFVRPAFPRSIPNLFRENSSSSSALVIAWLYKGERNQTESGRWEITNTQQPIAIFNPVKFTPLDALNPEASIFGKPFVRAEKVIQLNGRTFAYLNLQKADSISLSRIERIGVDVSSVEVLVLTGQGWRKVVYEVGFGRSGYPNGDGHPAPQFWISSYAYDNLIDRFTITIDSKHYVFYMGQPGLYIAPPANDHRIQRLSPDRWVHWHLADDSTRWTFEVVDTSGTIYATRTLRLDSDPRSIFVTQNYPDRSMAIIWGGIGGVRGTFLSQTLDLLQENMQISETRDSVSYPSAAYRNDTLFVAWEDYRNGGIADVYGTAFTGAPKASGVELERNPQQEAQTVQIWPNPAREVIQLSYPAAPEGTTVEIYDALGQLRLKKDVAAGSIGTGVAAEKLSPGMYLVVLNAGMHSTAMRCVVAR